MSASSILNKVVNSVKGVALFLLRSTVGYMPMMLLRLISRKINEKSAASAMQHQREYAQTLASRMRGGGAPGAAGSRPVPTHYQPPYYYNEMAYGKDISDELEVTYE